MAFLLGQNKSVENIPGDITGLREGFANYMQTQGMSTLTGGAESPFIQSARDVFTQNRKQGLAQAKESAGNLTGSGFANTLGTTVNRSLADENNVIAQLMNSERGQMLQTILGLGTTGVAPPTQTYQPGFLDYLFEGGQAVASSYGASR